MQRGSFGLGKHRPMFGSREVAQANCVAWVNYGFNISNYMLSGPEPVHAVSEVSIYCTPPLSLSPIVWYPPDQDNWDTVSHTLFHSNTCVSQDSCFSFLVSSITQFKTQLFICYSALLWNQEPSSVHRWSTILLLPQIHVLIKTLNWAYTNLFLTMVLDTFEQHMH